MFSPLCFVKFRWGRRNRNNSVTSFDFAWCCVLFLWIYSEELKADNRWTADFSIRVRKFTEKWFYSVWVWNDSRNETSQNIFGF